MTILVFDGVNLACDSRVSGSGVVISDNFNKMYEVNHPQLGRMVCALTGALDFAGPWLDNINVNGFAPLQVLGMDDDYDMSGLFIDSDGDCWVACTNGGYYNAGKSPVALGSSVPLATYLLNKGKNALTCVREINSISLYCGGKIKVYNAKTGKVTEYEE